jgi:hypothetical protein
MGRIRRAAVVFVVGAGVVAGPAPTAGATAISSTFATTTEGWLVTDFPSGHVATPPPTSPATFDAANGNPPGSLRVPDLFGETAVTAPAAYLGDKHTYLGGSISYDVIIRHTDAIAYPEALLRGTTNTLFFNSAAPPALNVLEHRTIPLDPSLWRVGAPGGVVATSADMTAVLTDLVSLAIITEWKTGEDDTTVDNIVLTDGGPLAEVAFTTANRTVAEGPGTVTIPVRRTGDLSGAASVQWAITGGTAAAGEDYQPTAGGTLNWGNGQGGNRSITVQLFGDALDESRETIILSLSNATGSALGALASHEVRLTDDDAPPTVSITSPNRTVAEGGQATVRVALSAASGRRITVPLDLVFGTASAADASISRDSLVFLPGTTAKVVAVLAAQDGLVEPTEALDVVLLAPTNATLGAVTSRSVSITDDD